MNDIPGWIEGLPVLEVLCERPNSGSPEHVHVIAWCKRCNRLHSHGARRIEHEEFMPRYAHCSGSGSQGHYQIHRIPGQKTHSQDGITAPVLDVVGWRRNSIALVICPKCCKKHRHYVQKGVEYTLVDGRCYPRYFAYQEIRI